MLITCFMFAEGLFTYFPHFVLSQLPLFYRQTKLLKGCSFIKVSVTLTGKSLKFIDFVPFYKTTKG